MNNKRNTTKMQRVAFVSEKKRRKETRNCLSNEGECRILDTRKNKKETEKLLVCCGKSAGEVLQKVAVLNGGTLRVKNRKLLSCQRPLERHDQKFIFVIFLSSERIVCFLNSRR